MKPYSEETRQKVLELLQSQRSQKEISERTAVTISTIQDWATEWRTKGLLVGYRRPGMEFTAKAKEMSNGYYKSIRKRYLGMKWTDNLEKRTFGFNSPIEAIHYYLDDSGNPRPCGYCGRYPALGKVWGLDRLDSSIGHIPGNLIPCCSSHPESHFLSCQTSKSKFSLFSWLESSMNRAAGHPINRDEVTERIIKIYKFAKSLI